MPDDKPLYAYLAQNERVGAEQLVAGILADGIVAPIYAWSFEELEKHRPIAEAFAAKYKVAVEVVMYERRRVLETIQPPGEPQPQPKPNRAQRRAAKKKVGRK